LISKKAGLESGKPFSKPASFGFIAPAAQNAGDPSQMGRRLCGEPIFANSLGGKRFHHLTKAR
jgi:hypothetical protein